MEKVAEIFVLWPPFPILPRTLPACPPLSRYSELAARFVVESLGSTQHNGYGHKYHL
jgi:hypothetical protein